MPTDWSIGLWAHEVKNNNAVTASVTFQAKDGTVLEQESLVFTPSENSQKLFKKDNHVKVGYIQFGILLFFLIPSLWFFYCKKIKLLCVTEKWLG